MSRHLERRVILEACNPKGLLEKPSGVSIRLLDRNSKAPGCDFVELRGTRQALRNFYSREWLEDPDEIAELIEWPQEGWSIHLR